MTPEPCPECKGKCCRDSYRYKLAHMGDEFYEHVCEACEDGTKYTAPPTYEDGLAEGERRATAAVVAWLEELSASSLHHDPVAELQYAARSIERGDHRREETK